MKRKKSKYLAKKERKYFFLIVVLYCSTYLALFAILMFVRHFYPLKENILLISKLVFFVIAYALTRIYANHPRLLTWCETSVHKKVARQKHTLKNDDKNV